MGIWKTLLDILAEDKARKYTNLNIATIELGRRLRIIKDRITEIEKKVREINLNLPQKPTEEEIQNLQKLNAMKNSLSLEAAQIAYLISKIEKRLYRIENSFFLKRLRRTV
jgi:hypothetical protein